VISRRNLIAENSVEGFW